MASLTVIQGSGIFSQQQDGIVGTPSPTHHSDQLSLPSILTMDKMNSDFSKSSIDASNLLDTTYQRAILSARARLLGGEPPRYPEEWRLPYAPLPARPDLTRTVFFGDQRIGHRKEHRRRGRDRSKTHPMSETDSFTTDYSMQLHLPPLNVSHDALSTSTAPQTSLPSATGTSRLQLKSPRSDRVYLPFVGMATLHPKLLTSTDVREKEYDIPQFCYGCRKFMEFTHAQHSSNGVYVHFDDSSSVKPLSNDENLKDERQHPDMSNAVNLVEFPKRGEFCHGCDVSSKPHLHLLQSASSAGGITLVTQHDDVTTPSEQKQGGQGEKDSSEHPAIEYSQDDLEDFLRHPRVEDIPAMIKKIQKPLEPLHQPTKARQRPPRIPQCVLDILKSGSIEYRKKLFEDRCTACMEALQKYFPEYFQRKVPTNPAPSSGIGTSITSSEFWAEEQQRLKDRQELLEARKKLRLEEKERQKIEELERQKRLYTAPKPFQLKPVEPKTTEAKDPFSKDRKIDLPKSKPFEIKKSSKPVTKSIPVSHERTTWKEPKKFEIKKEPPKVTNTDWKPPPKPNRIPSIVQQPLPPTPHEEPIEEKKTAEKTAEEEEKKPLSPIEERLPKIDNPQNKEHPQLKERPQKKLIRLPEKKSQPATKKLIENSVKTEKPKITAPAPKNEKTPPISKEKKKIPPQEPPKRQKPEKPEHLEPVKVIIKPTLKTQLEKPVMEKLPKIEKSKTTPLPKQTTAQKRKPMKPVKASPIKPPKKIEKKRKKKLKRLEEQLKKIVDDANEPLASSEMFTTPLKDPTPSPIPPPSDPLPLPSPTPPEATSPERSPDPPSTVASVIVEPKPKPKSKPVPSKKKREYVAIPIIPYKPPVEVLPKPPGETTLKPTTESELIREPLLTVIEKPTPLTVSEQNEDNLQETATTVPITTDSALIPKDSNRKSKTAKIPRPVLKRSTPKKTAKIVQKPYKRTTFGPLPERQRSEPVHYGAAPEWPEERTPEPEPEVEKAPSPIPPPVESPIPEAVEPPVEVPSARTVSKQEAIMWKKRPEYRPKKFKPPAPSVIEQPTSSPEPDESNTLDYLAKYCIVFKSRVPFYQRIFNNYLRDQGVPIVDDVIHKSFTKERLKEHDAMTSSTSSKDPDVASVTSRTSGYVSGSNDDVGKVTNQDALQSTFAKSQPINELEEDDYISPMNIQQDSSDTDESEASDDNDENIMNNDVISNDDVSDGQEIGLTRDAKKRIEAKIGTKQLYNTFAADDYSKLLTFEIDRKSQRAEMLKEQLHTLNEGKNRTVAAIARKEFQEIFDPEWTQERSDFHARKEKEKTKKAAKKKGGSESVSQESIADVIPPVRSPTTLLQKSKKSRENNPPMKMEKLVDMTQTDEWILARLATNQWQTLSTIPEVKEMNLEIERTEEKITAAETQLIELKAENKMVNTVAKNLRGEEHITRTSMKDKFRRQQSMIYQRLNPLQEYEIDLAEFEKLLQQINGNLITEKECQFIFHILELPSRYRLNFKLFAVVAALSEKVSRLEPFIRKLINQMDFDALDVKMQRAKELFHLLEEEDVFGNRTGEIPVRNLAYELEAGGLKEDHIQMVTDKFDREDKGVVDFLDYVTYIPLFIDIHDSIVSDPFGTGSSFYSK
ncbi:uncharacterized protein [Apostichopus japonicus]|uniref:uncharacterized protein isoform X3 n=1 Tax=Stichopus japonicus TaxID=307972 RepID=UPI003AB3EA8F